MLPEISEIESHADPKSYFRKYEAFGVFLIKPYLKQIVTELSNQTHDSAFHVERKERVGVVIAMGKDSNNCAVSKTDFLHCIPILPDPHT
jgi:hypothetical protein